MPTSWSQCSLLGSESTRVRLQFCQIEGQVLGSQNASGSGRLKPPHIHRGGVGWGGVGYVSRQKYPQSTVTHPEPVKQHLSRCFYHLSKSDSM